jgi:cell division protein FtsB
LRPESVCDSMHFMENLGLIRTTEPLRLRHALIPVVCLIVISYFAYHAVYGRHGFIAWLSLQNRVDTLTQQLDDTRLAREQLDRQVALLRPESIDQDLLEERAQVGLGFAHPDDVVIFRDNRAVSGKPLQRY